MITGTDSKAPATEYSMNEKYFPSAFLTFNPLTALKEKSTRNIHTIAAE